MIFPWQATEFTELSWGIWLNFLQ